jgi:hypothetical protein
LHDARKSLIAFAFNPYQMRSSLQVRDVQRRPPGAAAIDEDVTVRFGIDRKGPDIRDW